jgi:hypothetical protein
MDHEACNNQVSAALRTGSQNLERFRQLVVADRSLLEQLRQTGDLPAFVALAVRLGAERDCAFTEADVRAALRERRHAWLERWI